MAVTAWEDEAVDLGTRGGREWGGLRGGLWVASPKRCPGGSPQERERVAERALLEAAAVLSATDLEEGGAHAVEGHTCLICFEALAKNEMLVAGGRGGPRISHAPPATVVCQACSCSYHLSCLMQWLQTRQGRSSRKNPGSCPHCRMQISRLLCVQSFSPEEAGPGPGEAAGCESAVSAPGSEKGSVSPAGDLRWARASALARLNSSLPSQPSAGGGTAGSGIHVVEVESLWSRARALPHRSTRRGASASVAPESPPPEVRTLVAQALELRDDRAILLALKLIGLLMFALGLGLFLILYY